MNILHISASYKPAYIYGGPIVSVSELCEMLVKSGEDARVFTTTANGALELQTRNGKWSIVDGVPVLYFKRLSGDPTHFSPALLNSLWRSAPKYDIIHVHAWWNTVSVLACLVGLLKGSKVVLSPRGMLSSYSLSNRRNSFKKAIHFMLGKALLKKCWIHATSSNERNEIFKLTGSEKITVIPNLVRIPKQHFGAHSPADVAIFKLLFLSRIDEKKGLDILFKALGEIKIPFSLSIAGDGEEAYTKALKSLARQSGIMEKINWLGHLDQQHKFSCMQSHDLLILPSHNENFANVVIESLSVGLPVLVSENVGLADYILKSGLGWVRKADPLEFRTAIEEIFRDVPARNRIMNESPDQVRRDFDETAIVQCYRDFYKKILA